MRNNYKDVVYLLLDKQEELDMIRVDFNQTKKHTPLMPKHCIKCNKTIKGKHHVNRDYVMCQACYSTNQQILDTITDALSRLN